MEKLNVKNLFSVAEVQLVYKSRIKPSERPKISGSQDAYKIIKAIWDEETIELQEQFKVLLLNRANKVIGIYSLASGGTAGVAADPKLIFAAALKSNSASIIVSHNHPSGNLKPSHCDLALTSKLRQAGEVLDIPVLDHLIISAEGYLSLADEGLL